MPGRIQVLQNFPSIAPEDLTGLGINAQSISFIVSTTLRLERSPDSISPTEAENLVEILDRVVSSATVHPSLKDKCLGVLRNVSPTHRVLPKSYFPPGVTLLSDSAPHASGGFADVWKGQLDGNEVCVKAFRIQTASNPDRIKERFYREVVGWKHVSHPNVLPFLGVSETLFPFCIIRPWLPNGNITEHIQKHPEVNRLKLLAQAACGLEHLHSLSIVHSSITPGNILITEEGDACIGDFGITAIITDPTVVERANMTTSNPGATRYMAPELLHPTQFGLTYSNPSKESDVYSFAMTAYELLTGDVPYSGEQEGVAAFRIVSGIRPSRPINPIASHRLPDKIWDAIRRCWDQAPHSRSPIHLLRQELAQLEQNQKRATSVTENGELNNTAKGHINDTRTLSLGQSQPEETNLTRQVQPSTGSSSKRPNEFAEPEQGEGENTVAENGEAKHDVVQFAGGLIRETHFQPEEKNLGQNVRPLTKLPDERPEPVRPPSLERNRPKITQPHTKSEVIRQRTGSTGLPPNTATTNASDMTLSSSEPLLPEEQDQAQSAQRSTKLPILHTESPAQPLLVKRNPFADFLAGFRRLARRVFRKGRRVS